MRFRSGAHEGGTYSVMAELHPQIVHFTIVLVIIGVAFRLVSLVGRPVFAGPAAATLLILAAGAARWSSVQSGTAAHGPVERVPGSRAAVVEHEEWGERARNVALALGALEVLALALRRSPKVRYVHAAAAVVGLIAVFAVYEAAEHGGELVYGYAGGVGIRSGDPQDVERLAAGGPVSPGPGRTEGWTRRRVRFAHRRGRAALPGGRRGAIDGRRVSAGRSEESRGGRRRADRDQPAAGQSHPADAARDAAGRRLRGRRGHGLGRPRPRSHRRRVPESAAATAAGRAPRR